MPRKVSDEYKAKQRTAIQLARQALQRKYGVVGHDIAEVRMEIENIYGPMTDDNWRAWLRKVQASSDKSLPPGVCSSITRHLLRCNAMRLQGNQLGSPTKQIRCEALAEVALNMAESQIDDWLSEYRHIPEQMSPIELEQRIRILTMQTYSPRHLRRFGIRRRKPVYFRSEVIAILERINCA